LFEPLQQLQCVGGTWQLRNSCNGNQYCTCTGSKDLICRNIGRELNATEIDG
jgi:hypothetical protein